MTHPAMVNPNPKTSPPVDGVACRALRARDSATTPLQGATCKRDNSATQAEREAARQSAKELIDNVISRSMPLDDSARQDSATDARHGTGKAVALPCDTPILPVPPEELKKWPLDRLTEAGGIVPVRSRLLACEVLFVGDGAEVPAGESRPVYRVAELVELLRANTPPEVLRQIHQAKVTLAGEVLPAGAPGEAFTLEGIES